MLEVLRANLLSPITLAFALGVAARVARSEFSLPRDVYQGLATYLLFAIGLKGGVELSHTSFDTLAGPAAVTLLLGALTPVAAYLILRRLGGFGSDDAAGIAAHYGSVSAVTFIAAQQFVAARGFPAEGFMATLLALLESPGIHIALAIGAVQRLRAARPSTANLGVSAGGALMLGGVPGGSTPLSAESRDRLRATLHEVLTGRTMVLLVGGLVVGFLMGAPGWDTVSPFFDSGFKGALTLFLLEMGVLAGARLGDLRKVGPFLLGFAVLFPLASGTLGVALGAWAGLSTGGCAVLGTMAASASYIAAPPAVRLTLPDANPTFSLTAALAMTFPFNILVGIPAYLAVARALTGA